MTCSRYLCLLSLQHQHPFLFVLNDYLKITEDLKHLRHLIHNGAREL